MRLTVHPPKIFYFGPFSICYSIGADFTKEKTWILRYFETDQVQEAARDPHIRRALSLSNGDSFWPWCLYGSSLRLWGRIYSAKGRPSDNPLILHVWNPGMLEEIVG
jgi:hypothetical protein